MLPLEGGPTLAYDDEGRGDPAIVFSHGLFMDRTMFAPQVGALAERHRCVSWDARGHGDTVSAGPFTYWDSARDLLALMDHLGLDSVVHVGMSQGGLVAQRAAVLAPERFTGIVFLGSQAGHLVGDSGTRFMRIADDWLRDGHDEATLDFIGDLILGAGVDQQYWKERWRMLDPTRPRDFMHALVEREDFHPRLGEITAPVLIVHGAEDASTPVERARAVAAGVADCRKVVVVEGAPHAANLSHPDVVTAAIADFVASLRLS